MKPLQQTIQELQERSMLVPGNIRKERLATLDQLAHWISGRPLTEPTYITVICTHNSRRSHLGQVWLQAAAWQYEFDNLRTWSGGTEGTALYPSAAEALRTQGGRAEPKHRPGKPHLSHPTSIRARRPSMCLASGIPTRRIPKVDLGAILVCSEANEACPIVSGAAARLFAALRRTRKSAMERQKSPASIKSGPRRLARRCSTSSSARAQS